MGLFIGAGASRPEANADASFEIDKMSTTRSGPALTRRHNQEIDVDSLLADADVKYASLGSLRAEFVQRIYVPLLNRSKDCL